MHASTNIVKANLWHKMELNCYDSGGAKIIYCNFFLHRFLHTVMGMPAVNLDRLPKLCSRRQAANIGLVVRMSVSGYRG